MIIPQFTGHNFAMVVIDQPFLTLLPFMLNIRSGCFSCSYLSLFSRSELVSLPVSSEFFPRLRPFNKFDMPHFNDHKV